MDSHRKVYSANSVERKKRKAEAKAGKESTPEHLKGKKPYTEKKTEKTELCDMGVSLLPIADRTEVSGVNVQNNNNNDIPTEQYLNDFKKDLTVMSSDFTPMKSVSRKKQGTDLFTKLSDELVLMIMKFLPKRSLTECAYVCQRWRQISYDESLWTRIDLSGRTLRSDVMGYVLTRNPRILRMAQSTVSTPLFKDFCDTDEFLCKVEYLDLSMASITSEDLALLLSKCNDLRKLSLEHCITNESVCKSISKNVNLETLNLSLCYKLNENGLKSIVENCQKLEELNLQWTKLQTAAIATVCKYVNIGLKFLNVSGCETLTDNHIEILLKRCNNIIELDLSDCMKLKEGTVTNLLKYVPKLAVLSLSRCYGITPSLYGRIVKKPSLKIFNIFGLLHESHLKLLEKSAPELQINGFKFSSTARPTVGIRRTSIWGIRVRD